MMKEASHFDQVKRLRISDKELVPFTAAYDVRNLVKLSNHSNTCSLTPYLRLHFPS